MAEEYQITIQVEQCQTPVKPKTPTSLHFSDKREAIVVQEDGYHMIDIVRVSWELSDEMDRM